MIVYFPPMIVYFMFEFPKNCIANEFSIRYFPCAETQNPTYNMLHSICLCYLCTDSPKFQHRGNI